MYQTHDRVPCHTTGLRGRSQKRKLFTIMSKQKRLQELNIVKTEN